MIEINPSAYKERRIKNLFKNITNFSVDRISVFPMDYAALLKPLAAHAKEIGICYKGIPIVPYRNMVSYQKEK